MQKPKIIVLQELDTKVKSREVSSNNHTAASRWKGCEAPGCRVEIGKIEFVFSRDEPPTAC